MVLLILSNICFILSLLLVLEFINKISENKNSNLKGKIIITTITLFIINCIYYFDYDKESILFF